MDGQPERHTVQVESSPAVEIRAGAPLRQFQIISGHTHVGNGWNHPINGPDCRSMLKTMDALGINVSCISSMRALGPDLRGGNAEVARWVASNPNRFIGTVVANPHYLDDSLKDLEQYFSLDRFGMIKVHPEFHAYPIDGPNYEAIWQFASERKIPVLTHTWGFGRGYDHPTQVIPVLRSHPEIPLVLGHAGGTPEGLHASVAVAAEFSNAYLDTATSLVYRGAIEFLVESVGAHRVIFGTDAAYIADAPQVARIVGADLDLDQKSDILGKNLRRLLEHSGLELSEVWTKG